MKKPHDPAKAQIAHELRENKANLRSVQNEYKRGLAACTRAKRALEKERLTIERNCISASGRLLRRIAILHGRLAA